VTYRIGILFMVSIILLGGCQADKDETSMNPSEIDKEDLPDVHAFVDEFTRDFLQSTEETEEGFYPFLSKTKRYKMDFPGGGVIDDRAYFIKEKVHEEVHISIEDDTGFGMDVIYYSGNTKDLLEEDLHAFKKRLGYDGDLKKLKKSDRSIYYAHFRDNGFDNYIGYVLNGKGDGGIELNLEIDCRDKKKKACKENKQSNKERAMKWMESVQFINENEGEDREGRSHQLRQRMAQLEYEDF